ILGTPRRATMPDDPALCERLAWDTAFFGFPIARIKSENLTADQIPMIDDWCKQEAIRCLYFLSNSDTIESTQVAEEHGFHLVDIRLTLSCDVALSAQNYPIAVQGSSSLNMRAAHAEDIPVLKDIAARSYTHTRFFIDPHFPKTLSAALYEKWIERSCQGYADAVILAEAQARPVGYISCHRNGGNGNIGLLGVAEEARGLGIARNLIMSALQWFQTAQVQTVTVVTQGRNYAAQRAYQRCGFVTESIRLWYHRWL
ncbi:MAG TPA: GNAT family N-acetyltransferase, partial [Aggregatilineales bacterium]|nr:GNAT family N-acetyltransferase [Aggregatilineales bacterium]